MDDGQKYLCISDTVCLGRHVRLTKFINLYGCHIGDNTRIGAFVEIQKNATIGNNCKISSHTFICEGVSIGDNVFVGHNVTFINDKYPCATNPDGSLQTEDDWVCTPTRVKDNVCIGSGTTVLCGVTIHEGSLIGAGSVITKDVPPGVIAAGNPARIIRRIRDD